MLAGLVVLFAGWSLFRAVLFPWAFLFLMIPIPAIIFNQITFPLQILASQIAAATLPLFGVPVLRQGNVMTLASQVLQVAEACSGIRSLMSLATLAIIYGYLMESRLWIRYVLALAVGADCRSCQQFPHHHTGLMVEYWDPDKAEGYFHTSWGWIVFVISLLMLYGVHAVIRGCVRRGRSMKNMTARFVVAALLIATTAIFMHAHNRQEVFPRGCRLQWFPAHLGSLN